jgi:VCBS repeat-containing protein
MVLQGFPRYNARRMLNRNYYLEVPSEIKVEMPSSAIRTDEDIARTTVNNLEWNYIVLPSTVKVQVTDGYLALKGSAEWQYQKEAAERAVRALRSVQWVSNAISVTPGADAVRSRGEKKPYIPVKDNGE